MIDPMKHVYTKILDTFRGEYRYHKEESHIEHEYDYDNPNLQDDYENMELLEDGKVLAEVVITPDTLTNGLLEDT